MIKITILAIFILLAAIMNGEVGFFKFGLFEPTDGISQISHAVDERWQLIVFDTERLPKLIAYSTGHEASVLFRVQIVRIAAREQMSLLLSLQRLCVEQILVYFNAFLIHFDWTILNSVIDRQAVKTLLTRPFDSQRRRQSMIFREW